MKNSNVAAIIIAGVAGTTFMSLFSYLVSNNKKRNFREPQILGNMTHRIVPVIDKKKSEFTGWVLHYCTGIFFAAIYERSLHVTRIKPNLVNGIVFGGLAGLTGIGVWKKTFDNHPNPPQVNRKRYFGHLLVSHVVYGVFTYLGLAAVSHLEKKHVEKYNQR